jgi:hypothetical protein
MNETAILRPLRQPLFDSEFLPAGTKFEKIKLFERAVGQPMLFCAREKTNHHTNLNQRGQLCFPLEFSILGFNFFADEQFAEGCYNRLISEGLFTFTYSGGRSYLQIPLIRMPRHRTKVCAADLVYKIYDENSKNVIKNPTTEQFSEFNKKREDEAPDKWAFNIGKSALRIRAGESFGVTLSWPYPIELKTSGFIYGFIDGLTWTPL